jgi:glycosyltransferase involved in cell wall biosynthesis
MLRSTPLFDPERVHLTVHFLSAPHPAAVAWPATCAAPEFLGARKWDPCACRTIRALLRRTHADVVHLGGMKSILLGRLAAHSAGVPALVHFHDTQPVTTLLRWAQRTLRSWTAGAVAVSDAVGRVAEHRFGFPPGFVRTLYNGVDIAAFQNPAPDTAAATRAECGWNGHHRVATMVGRLRREKSADVLLRCFARLRETAPHLRLLFVGDGPERAALERQATADAVRDRVHFAGDRRDVPRWLAASDALALPTLAGEGFPVSGIEALAAGKPVLGFRAGGLPELVRHGEEGWLAAPGDEDGLTEGLRQLLTDDALRARLGDAAARRAQAFTLDAHVRHLEETYARVARPHGVEMPP